MLIVDTTDLHRCFDDKVANVRAATADADPPTSSSRLSHVTADDVADLRSLPDKHCRLDPLPSWLLKQNSTLISPFLYRLFNWSLERSVVSLAFKSANVTPILKKTSYVQKCAEIEHVSISAFHDVRHRTTSYDVVRRRAVPEQIRYKLCVLVYGAAPKYLADSLRRRRWLTASTSFRQLVDTRHCLYHPPVAPRSWRPHFSGRCGTVCDLQFATPPRYLLSLSI